MAQSRRPTPVLWWVRGGGVWVQQLKELSDGGERFEEEEVERLKQFATMLSQIIATQDAKRAK